MKKSILLACLSVIFYVLLPGCKKTATTDTSSNSSYVAAANCTGVTPTYTTDIKPILNLRCATAGCHAAVNPAHNLDLTTYALIKRDFDLHEFLCSINQDGTCSKMPQGSAKLADADIKKITCWAKNGFAQ
jgi:hypothetical protein